MNLMFIDIICWHNLRPSIAEEFQFSAITAKKIFSKCFIELICRKNPAYHGGAVQISVNSQLCLADNRTIYLYTGSALLSFLTYFWRF